MKPFAEVVGDPIAFSKSPSLHRFWLEALGIEAEYRAHFVPKGNLEAYLAERRADPAWRGCNLTAPHKESALEFLDALTPRASAIGAVNIVYRDNDQLIGDNSDDEGIAEALPKSSVAEKRIVLLGAGGAARAALSHLIQCGALHIHLLARRPQAASNLVLESGGTCPISIGALDRLVSFEGADVLVNASPLGMAHAPMPNAVTQALATMNPAGLVFDMVYEPLETPLLTTARKCSLATVDGFNMLIGQARRSFKTFFGRDAPQMLDGALRAALTKSGMARPIVLVGLPGAGKTTVGQALAKWLDLPFFDSDREIEQITRLTIAQIFERRGEAEFRKLERDVVGKLIGLQGCVIALGGGALTNSHTRMDVHEHCTSVWIDTPVEIIHSRLEGSSDRPLLRGANGLQMLQSIAGARAPSYTEANIRVSGIDLIEAVATIVGALAIAL